MLFEYTLELVSIGGSTTIPLECCARIHTFLVAPTLPASPYFPPLVYI